MTRRNDKGIGPTINLKSRVSRSDIVSTVLTTEEITEKLGLRSPALPQTSHIITHEEASFGFLPDLCSPKNPHYLHRLKTESPAMSSRTVENYIGQAAHHHTRTSTIKPNTQCLINSMSGTTTTHVS
jgi:hypothetical protein